MILLLIFILITSVYFLAKFLNYNVLNSAKNLLLHAKKSSIPTPSPSPALISTSSAIETSSSCMGKDDDLKQVFDTFDKNGDGFITKEELKESLNKIGILVPVEELEEMVDNLDSNKDGLIDIDEFRELYHELVRKEDESKVGVEDDGFLKEAFDMFDEDKDGFITVKELGLMLSSLSLKEGNFKEEDCKEMISKVDVDGDGMVNFDEFKVMMRTSRASPRLVGASS